jgi:hypothetical protein
MHDNFPDPFVTGFWQPFFYLIGKILLKKEKKHKLQN